MYVHPGADPRFLWEWPKVVRAQKSSDVICDADVIVVGRTYKGNSNGALHRTAEW